MGALIDSVAKSGFVFLEPVLPTFHIDDEYRDFFQKYGFVHIKNVFSQEEVRAMRRECEIAWDRTGGKPSDLLSTPELKHVLLDERVLRATRKLIGERVIYYGESTYAVNVMRERFMHVDSRDDTEDPSRTEFPVVRFGVYLQDHATHSDGLKIQAGSHREVMWNLSNAARFLGLGHGNRLSLSAYRFSPYYNIPSEPGDLLLWSLRTHHCGHARRIKGLPRIALPPVVEKLLPDSVQAPLSDKRCAVFGSFARPSALAERHIHERVITPFNKRHWQVSDFDRPELIEEARKAGLEVRIDGRVPYQKAAQPISAVAE